MNDRFKFRYVHEYKKKVYNVAAIDFNQKILSVANIMTVREFNYNNLLQCTGLKDRNGTLIYEGDIINSEKYGNRCGYVVKWNEKGFWQVNSNNALASIVHLLSTDYEVIGNIYENPELLSVRNEE